MGSLGACEPRLVCPHRSVACGVDVCMHGGVVVIGCGRDEGRGADGIRPGQRSIPRGQEERASRRGRSADRPGSRSHDYAIACLVGLFLLFGATHLRSPPRRTRLMFGCGMSSIVSCLSWLVKRLRAFGDLRRALSLGGLSRRARFPRPDCPAYARSRRRPQAARSMRLADQPPAGIGGDVPVCGRQAHQP